MWFHFVCDSVGWNELGIHYSYDGSYRHQLIYYLVCIQLTRTTASELMAHWIIDCWCARYALWWSSSADAHNAEHRDKRNRLGFVQMFVIPGLAPTLALNIMACCVVECVHRWWYRCIQIDIAILADPRRNNLASLPQWLELWGVL